VWHQAAAAAVRWMRWAAGRQRGRAAETALTASDACVGEITNDE